MEEDVEIFLENEKQSAQQDTSALSDEMRPDNGMQFKSREEPHQFLNMYSFAASLSIAVSSVYRTTRKKRNNEITRAISMGTTQKLKMRKWKVRGRPQYLSELIAK